MSQELDIYISNGLTRVKHLYITNMKPHSFEDNYILHFSSKLLDIYTYTSTPVYISSLNIKEHLFIDFMSYDEASDHLPILFHFNETVNMTLLTIHNGIPKLSIVTTYENSKEYIRESHKQFSIRLSPTTLISSKYKGKLTIFEFLKNTNSFTVTDIKTGFAYPIYMFKTKTENTIGCISTNYVSNDCYTIIGGNCKYNKGNENNNLDQDKMNGYTIYFVNVQTKKLSSYLSKANNIKDYYINFRIYNDKIYEIIPYSKSISFEDGQAKLEFVIIGGKNIYTLDINEANEFNKQIKINDKLKGSKKNEMVIIRNNDFQNIKQLPSLTQAPLEELNSLTTTSLYIGRSICAIPIPSNSQPKEENYIVITKEGLVHLLSINNTPKIMAVFDLKSTYKILTRVDAINIDQSKDLITIVLKMNTGNDLALQINYKDTEIIKKESFKVREIETLTDLNKMEYVSDLDKWLICKDNRIYTIDNVLGTLRDYQEHSLFDNVICIKELKEKITIENNNINETDNSYNEQDKQFIKIENIDGKKKAKLVNPNVNLDDTKNKSQIKHQNDEHEIKIIKEQNKLKVVISKLNQGKMKPRKSTNSSSKNNTENIKSRKYDILIEGSERLPLFTTPISIYLHNELVYLIDENNLIYSAKINAKDSFIDFKVFKKTTRNITESISNGFSNEKQISARFIPITLNTEKKESYFICTRLYKKKVQILLLNSTQILAENNIFIFPFGSENKIEIKSCGDGITILKLNKEHYYLKIKKIDNNFTIKHYKLTRSSTMNFDNSNNNNKEEYMYKFKVLIPYIQTEQTKNPTFCYCKHSSKLLYFDTHLKLFTFNENSLKNKSKNINYEDFGWDGVHKKYNAPTFLKCFMEDNIHMIVGGLQANGEVSSSKVFVILEHKQGPETHSTATVIESEGCANDALLLPKGNLLLAVEGTIKQYCVENGSLKLKAKVSSMRIGLKLIKYNNKIIAIDSMSKVGVFYLNEESKLTKDFEINQRYIFMDAFMNKNMLFIATYYKEMPIVIFGEFYKTRNKTNEWTICKFLKKNDKIYGVGLNGMILRIKMDN